jgi:hypothetical protein
LIAGLGRIEQCSCILDVFFLPDKTEKVEELRRRIVFAAADIREARAIRQQKWV